MFNEEELDYIYDLVVDSKRSLDELCDSFTACDARWISKEDLAKEYRIINSILSKIRKV